MITHTWLSATLAVCIIAIAPSSSAEDFSIDLTQIYYQDGSGREIDYDFSTGSIDEDGRITIPGSAVLQRAPGEAGTTFLWEPIYGDVQSELGAGFCRMSIPQADIGIPPIPSATIAVDGDPADWAAVGPYVQDTNTLEDDVSQPGTDVEYVKLAYSPDGTRLNILFKVTDAISPGVWYRMFFTRDTDNISRPGNYQVDFQHGGGGWEVVSQGWDSEGQWYPIDEYGLAAASGAFIEGSFDVAALGLGSEFFFRGRTMQSEAPYAHYDYFGVSEFEQEGLCAIGAWNAAAPASGDSIFEVTVTNFQNVGREQYYFDIDAGLGSWEPGPQPELGATWFTGVYQGTHYENALVLGAEVYNEASGQEWESAEIVLEGLDPSTTTLDLKVEVTGGTTFSASYRVNDGAGPWQPLWQHTITQGQMRGFPELFPYVYMETGYESTGLDIQNIFIGQFNSHVNGVPDAPNPYEAEVFVEGTGITDVSVQVPNGGVYPLVHEDDEWIMYQEFATDTGMLAVFGPGDYIFTFNGGADTVTLAYSVPEPTGCPSILYPAHLQSDVEEEPTFRWSSAAGLGQALGMWVIIDSDNQDDELYGQWNADINQTSWQPGPLAPDEDYEFELSVINFHGGAPQNAATDGGDSFFYDGTFECINIIEFTTGGAGPALDVEEIFIGQVKDYWDGSPFADPYGIEIFVAGTGLTQVSVEDPNGGLHPLAQIGADEWEFEDLGYADRTALEAVYGPGNYIFTFNGGADTVTLAYAPGEPAGFAPITYPANAQTEVELDPTYRWSSVDGFGDAMGMWVVRDPSGQGHDIYEAWQLGTSQTSWQPGPLGPNEEYEFELSVVTFGPGTPVGETTDGGDPFGYNAMFEYINTIGFTTGGGGPALDIEEILVGAFRNYVDGVEEPIPYEFEIEVSGTGITGVSVEVPNGGAHTLINYGGGEWWSLEEEFPSLAALQAAFGTGDYIFTFNGGFDSVTINHDVPQPTGFASIISPTHGEHSVDLNPTFEWESAVGDGDFLGMWMLEDPDGTDIDIYEAVPVDISTTSWQPGPLSDQTEYEFELAVVNGSLDVTTTDQGDAFQRIRVFAHVNLISFDTLRWCVPGDANNDRIVNILDMILVRNNLNQDPTSGDLWWVDVTEDGSINILDMIFIRNQLNATCDD